jgi:hypothetical protein
VTNIEPDPLQESAPELFPEGMRWKAVCDFEQTVVQPATEQDSRAALLERAAS